MATNRSLDMKLDSSADQIDDVETQKEHVELAEDSVSNSYIRQTCEPGVDGKTAQTSLRSERNETHPPQSRLQASSCFDFTLPPH